jgi:hypothetical protein
MSDQPNISTLSLSHGQVLQTIEAMHIAEWMDRPALDSVLKKLRRELVPFTAEELDKPQWEQVRYGYVHLVECVVAIKMMAEGIAHRHIVALLTVDRLKLREAYKTAFSDATKGLGKPISLKHPDGHEIHISGLYLDFMARVNALGVLTTTGPRLLDPWQAINRYMGLDVGMHPLPPIRLSDLATEAVRFAVKMPELKRGRKPSGH